MNIRKAREADYQQWLALWKGYQVFYKTSIADETTATTWSRFHNPGEPMHCAVAEAGASRVWWLTQETNTEAMLLYDRIADKSGFIQYRKLV